jgi:phosphopentomutase
MGKQVIGLGKIGDIFDRVGIGTEIRTESNSDGMKKTTELVRESDAELIFTNLVDFDSKYGHRNDVAGYSKALETFDAELAGLLSAMRSDDLLFITADHGCDPSDVSTDHTREYVPVLGWGRRARAGVNLGTRASLADVGQTIAENFGLHLPAGRSFLGEIV